VIINTVGPTWEGNQIWFVTAGGALFAAWPIAYSVAFSGFYFALLLTLFALFLRPIGFDYRSKLPSQTWRSNWDIALFVGGFVPALIFGVAFGNLLQGVPFHFDNDMRILYRFVLGINKPPCIGCRTAQLIDADYARCCVFTAQD
jgi:cytochrome d ubiquinol oxidase subunit II